MEKENHSSRQRWEKRAVLLFADDKNNRQLQEQTEIVASGEEGFRERDIDCLVVLSDSVEDLQGQALADLNAAKIRTDYEVRPGEFRYILIGKDGEVIMNESFRVKNEEVFKALDSAQESDPS